MILTCPQCASRYQVDGATIPPRGRTVRCAGCGTSWRAEAPMEDALELRPPVSAEPEAQAAKPAAAALPKSIRAKNHARKRTREAAVAGAVWGVLGAAVLILLAGAALFRVEVVRLWPRTAGAYAKVGLTVNPTGLAPENIQAGPGLQDGRLAVIVSGVVRNVETRAHEPVPVRVVLLDKAGRPLARQLVKLGPGSLQPGQTRPFSASFLDPPAESAGVEVAFAFDPVPPPRVRRAKMAETLKLRGRAEPDLPAVAKPARPLPASSPYALPGTTEANRPPSHEG